MKKWIVMLLILTALPAAAQFSPERPGAFYFGESSPGDGFISPADLATMVLLLKGVGGDYSFCDPPDSSIQDLDGDAFISPGDKAILAQWAKSIWPAVTGRAAELYIMDDAGLETATDAEFNLAEGDSISLSARAYDANNHNLRAGFGVLFHVTSANPLCDPLLEGHNPHSELTSRPDIIQDYTVHAYTQRPVAPDDGWATIKVPAPSFSGLGCFYGDTIRVTTAIPDDAVAGISGSRQPAAVTGPSFVITMVEAPWPVVVSSIELGQPDPVTLGEGQAQQVYAVCNYLYGQPNDDCSLAGGIVCLAAGDLGQTGCLVTGNQVPGPNGGSGTVTVWPVNNANDVSDANAVTVTNNDYVAIAAANPATTTVAEGGTEGFVVRQLWSDGFVDTAAGTGWQVQNSTCSTPGTVTSGGVYTAGQKLGPSGCSEQVDPVEGDPAVVTATNDDVVAGSPVLDPSSATVAEGGNQDFTIQRTWSDGYFDTIAGSGWQVIYSSCDTPGAVTGGGAYTAGQKLGMAGCSEQVDTAETLAATVTVTNDDAVVGQQIMAPNSIVEGDTIEPTVVQVLSDGSTLPLPGDTVSGTGNCHGYMAGSPSTIAGPWNFATVGNFPGVWVLGGTDQPSWREVAIAGYTNGSVMFPGTAYTVPPPANASSTFTFSLDTSSYVDLIWNGTVCTCRNDVDEPLILEYNCSGSWVEAARYYSTTDSCSCTAAPDLRNHHLTLPQECSLKPSIQLRYSLMAAAAAGGERSFIDDISITGTFTSSSVWIWGSHVPCSLGGLCYLSSGTAPVKTVAVINDDIPQTVNVTPESPVGIARNGNQGFFCDATYSDSCVENCSAGLYDGPGCGAFSGTTYMAPGSTCTDTANALWMGVSDAVDSIINVGCSIVLGPDPTSVSDGNTLKLSAMGQGGCIGDRTNSTTWSVVSGPCTISATGLLYTIEQCTGSYNCVIMGQYLGSGDTLTVAVVNNDSVSTQTISVPAGTVYEGGQSDLSVKRTWSDGCIDYIAGTGWRISSSNCTTSGTVLSTGAYTAGQKPCGTGCTEGVDTNETTPYTITVNNDDTEILRFIPATPVTEETSYSLTVTRRWSDLCEDIIGSITWTRISSTCSTPGTLGSNGSYVAGHMACGAGCTETVDTSETNPTTLTVNNNESIIASVIIPASATEGSDTQLNINRTWSDSCVEQVSGTGFTRVLSTCTNPGTVTNTGAYHAGHMRCSAGCTETISATGAGPTVITLTNDDVPSDISVLPSGPVTMAKNGFSLFSCIAYYPDSCTEDCSAGLYDDAGCGYITGSGYLAPDFTCTDHVNSLWMGISDLTPTQVDVSDIPSDQLSIVYIYPLRPTVDDRCRLNTATDQKLTVVVAGGVPDTVNAVCTGPSTVNFNCTGSGADPDWVCTPTTNFLSYYASGGGEYNCTVSATNSEGTANGGGTLRAGLPTVSATGGMAGGCVDGPNWDSATNYSGAASVSLTVIDAETRQPLAGKAYVQTVQGGTVDEFFTDAAGHATLSLRSAKIDELTIGYKCGSQRCEASIHGGGAQPVRNGYYGHYKFKTWRDLDARQLVLPLPLMDDAVTGRNRATITGTVPLANFNSYLGNRPTGDTNPIVRHLFLSPSKLRLGLVTLAKRDQNTFLTSLDDLLMLPDYDTSIAICVGNNPNPKISQILKARWPQNLVAPELIRTDWHNPCSAWNINPGRTDFRIHDYNPGGYDIVWALGIWVNAATLGFTPTYDATYWNLSRTTNYVAAVGIHGLPLSTSLRNAPYTTAIGTSAQFELDLREDWDGPLGYDPDTSVDRRFRLQASALLPPDPSRTSSRLLSGTYRLPNLTDSELAIKFGGTEWDKRFYRRDILMAGAVNLGPTLGTVLTGLQLGPKIDDAEFTTYMVGFFQSTGSGNYKAGHRNLRYWSGSTGDSEVSELQQAGPAGSFPDVVFGATSIDWTSITNGGPTNYQAIIALTRGPHRDSTYSDNAANRWDSKAIFQPNLDNGITMQVVSMGDPGAAGNENVTATDWFQLPQAVSPAVDQYSYPAPQWSNTTNGSIPINRNGELWRDRTVSATNGIQRDALSRNRRYVEFTRTGLLRNTARTAPDLWLTRVAESDLQTLDGATITGWRNKLSAEAGIWSTGGLAIGTAGIFQNVIDIVGGVTAAKIPYRQTRFVALGVAAGDSLVILSHKADCATRLYICAVNSNSEIKAAEDPASCAAGQNWTSLACTDPDVGGAVSRNIQGTTHIRYRIVRAHPTGECQIDDWYGQDNGACRSNAFWEAEGRGVGSGNIRVHIPEMTSGSATLHGATGTIPDLLDGLATGTQLEWAYVVTTMNSDAATLGGMGRAFNYNNRDLGFEQGRVRYLAQDLNYIYLQ